MAWMKRAIRWLSMTAVLIVLALVVAWHQLDRLLPWAVNELWQDPAVRITRLEGARLSTTGLEMDRLGIELAGQPLTFDDIRIAFDRHTPYWVTTVAIAAGEARLDIPALQRHLTGDTKSGATPKPVDISRWLALVPGLSLTDFRLVLQMTEAPLPPLVVERFGWQPGAQPSWQTVVRVGDLPWLTLSAALSQPERLTGDFTLAMAPLNPLLVAFSPLPVNLAGKDKGRFVLDWSQGLEHWSLTSQHHLQRVQLSLGSPALDVQLDGKLQLTADAASAAATLEAGTRLSHQLTAIQWPALADRIGLARQWRPVVAASLPLSGEITLSQPLDATLWPTPQIVDGALDWQVAGQGGMLQGEFRDLRYTAPGLSTTWQLTGSGRAPLLTAGLQAGFAQNEAPVSVDLLAFEAKGRLSADADGAQLHLAPATQLTVEQPATMAFSAGQLTLRLDDQAALTWRGDSGLAPFALDLHSELNRLATPQLQLTTLIGQHRIGYDARQLIADSQWLADDWPFTTHHEVTGLTTGVIAEDAAITGRLRVSPQPLAAPWSWWREPPPLFSLDANLGIELDYRVMLATRAVTATLGAALSDGSGSYDELRFDGLGGQADCRWADDQLHCDRLEGTLAHFDGGVDVTALAGRGELRASAADWQLTLDNARGELLDGAFSTDKLTVSRDQPVTGVLQLQHISLAALVALQKQEGISVSGFLDGELPFTLDTAGFRIDGGRLANRPPGGEIRINGNPAIDQLRLSQPQLEYALNALEWLDYDELTTDIDYRADGLATLAVSIRGRNPDITRPIHFNYSHEENLLQLLKSLRIGDELSEKIGEQFNQEE